ncbi:unnamed protein product [Ceutorhynchus assimilis]|uniref:Uncharacterized protein n=1 Tax=Ceutorhynchus assimilis TaxID=467358 RepID=A0A9P0DNS2_9CUCU|nr:unnamed protein product [Ceutorhynchus assimilis]
MGVPQQICFVFVLILSAFQISFAQQSNTEISQLETFYYNKCLKNTGRQEAFEKLRTNAYEMYKYFEYAFQYLPDKRKTFCDSERSNLVYRVKEIETDLKTCLDQQEKFLAGFFRKSFEEFLHFFCHHNGEYSTRFFSIEGRQCREAIENAKSSDLDNCLNRIFAPSKSHITQQEMCDDVTVTKKCFAQLLEVHCPTSRDMKQLNGIFFDYLAKPCSSCSFVVNGFLVLGLVLINLLWR